MEEILWTRSGYSAWFWALLVLWVLFVLMIPAWLLLPIGKSTQIKLSSLKQHRAATYAWGICALLWGIVIVWGFLSPYQNSNISQGVVIDKHQSTFRGRTNNVIRLDTEGSNLDATVPISVFAEVNLGDCLRVRYTQDPVLGGLDFTMVTRLSEETCR